MNCTCQYNDMIRKQREELILLTNDLKMQEEQITKLFNENKSLKSTVKAHESKQLESEKSAVKLNKEIISLKGQIKEKDDQLEAQKHKMVQKDFLIQNQARKIQQIQATMLKSEQELKQTSKTDSELKSENSKLNIKLKEQASRILNLKEKLAELQKSIQAKDELLSLSASHIQNLDKKLNFFIENVNSIKKSQPSTAESSTKSQSLPESKELEEESPAVEMVDHSQNRSLSSASKLAEVDEKNTAAVHDSRLKVTNSSDENQVNRLLQSLKEAWFESNTKYEEIKTLITSKLQNQQADEEITNKSVSSENQRLITSTPVSFRIPVA